MTKLYYSTKEYINLGSVAYRQWKADSHCNKLHGYSLSFKFEFCTPELDTRNWVQDYGGLRPLKNMLEDWFDHTLLVAIDDPMKSAFIRLSELGLAKIVEVEKTGCEGLAEWLMNFLNGEKVDYSDGYLRNLSGDRNIWCSKISVRETASNEAGVIFSPN